MSHDTVYDPKKPNMVYLRPKEGSRPVRYEISSAMQGMVLDRKHSIAMYTSRAGMAVGPAGPAGPQGPAGEPSAGLDTVIASCSDETTPITVGNSKTTFRSPYPLDMTNGYVRASLTIAPTGSSMIIDITMNGSSMFSTPIYIDAGSKTSVGSTPQSVVNIPLVGGIMIIPDDAEFIVNVTQVGSTLAGTGLKVAVTGKKADP
jgi:hypothetical protein